MKIETNYERAARERRSKLLPQIIDTALLAIFLVLALDLLYLYFAGGWYDPNPWVEKTELAALVAFSLVSIVRVIMRLRGMKP